MFSFLVSFGQLLLECQTRTHTRIESNFTFASSTGSLGLDSFLTKPGNFDQVKKIVEQLRVVLSNPIPGVFANVSFLVSMIPNNWMSGGDVTEDMDGRSGQVHTPMLTSLVLVLTQGKIYLRLQPIVFNKGHPSIGLACVGY